MGILSAYINHWYKLIVTAYIIILVCMLLKIMGNYHTHITELFQQDVHALGILDLTGDNSAFLSYPGTGCINDYKQPRGPQSPLVSPQ